MRIDAHVHGMHAEKGPDGRLVPPLMPAWRNTDMTPAEQVRRLNGMGVGRALLLDPAEITFELHRIFGDFVIPCPQVDLDNASPGDISELLGNGAIGIKFIAPMHPYGDDRYLPIYEAVRDHRALAVFHTGFLMHGFFDPGELIPRNNWVNISNMRPAELDRINRALPDLKILMAHFGNPWWEEAWKMIASNKNIYADLSGGTAYTKSMNMWKELFAPNGKLDVKVVSKLCYASDASLFSPGQFEFQELSEFYDRLYDALKLTDELKTLIDYGNIDMLVRK